MSLLRSILALVRAWRQKLSRGVTIEPSLLVPFSPMICRDVTPGGVRVYSLCGGCGARLERSATLCEECAQGPHPSAF